MSNIQPYIILNGTDSRTITGLLISALPPISKPLQRTLVDVVDGRDGDINTPLGFSAYDKVITIGLTYGYDIDDIIEYFNSAGVVTFSNEPDKYYRYAIYEQIDFERLIRFKTAEVTLHCQPFKFSTTETPELFNVTSGSPITVTNDGNTQSRPNLTIIGDGEVDVSLNGSQILSMDLADNQAVIIDSEDMNAYAAQSAIKEVIAEINPVQDLHGQANPYPAGGGNNKLASFVDGTYTNSGVQAIVNNGLITVTGQKTVTTGINLEIPIISNFTLHKNDYLHIRNNNANASIALSFVGASWAPTFAAQNRIIQYTGDDTTVTSITLYLASTVSETLNFTLKPSLEVSSATTDWTPYENICEISGFTECNVTLCGKNLAKEVTVRKPTTVYSGSWLLSVKFPFDIPKNTTINLSFIATNTSKLMTNTNVVTYLNIDATGERQNFTVATKVDIVAGTAYQLIMSRVNNNITTDFDDVQVVFGSQSSDYEAFAGNTYNTPFVDDQGDPIAVFGATLDVVRGKLKINKAIVDLGNLNWNYFARNTRFVVILNNGKFTNSGSGLNTALCEIYPVVTVVYGVMPDKSISVGSNFISGSTCALVIHDETYTNANELKTALRGQHIVYELATPIEIQLTPQIVNNLLGLNQMYCDTNGDIEVTVSSNGVIQTLSGEIVSFTVAVEDMQKGILLNRLVTGDYDKIRLNKGNNTLVLSGGAQQLVIDKYSRWI